MAGLKRDNDAAVAFLRMHAMNGPWALIAIETNRRGIKGKVFKSSQEDDLRTWLDEQGDNERNVYFHVNEVRGDIVDKARREDILRVTHLHVDIDPRAGENLAQEHERIRGLIDNPPEGVPAPSTVIFSGGGFWLLWRLEEPIEIDGDIDKAEAAKLYNLQLERLYRADHCHDISRIARLPGSLNLPDAKKLAKGREKALAYVVEDHEHRIYALSMFTAATEVQTIDTGFASATQVNISGNLEPAGSIDEIIEWATAAGGTLSLATQMLIVQGDDPDDPTKYGGDRSKALFACCCGMKRANLSDDQMYSIITDKDWLISRSVLDKGNSIERYAKRQIERAKEASIHPKLLEMNERHAVIGSYGGKCVVIEEVQDPLLKRSVLERQSFTDFWHRYGNQKISLGVVDGVEKFMPLGKWWTDHESRRQYDRIVFSPAGPVKGAYNLWQGFSCEATPGDCSKFLSHVKDNVCGGVEEYFEYLMSWMARAVQYPAEPGGVAIVLRGKRGTGKSIFVKFFGALWGRHFLQVSDAKHLVGSFNQHLKDCVVLFGDEAFFAGAKQHEGTLKTLITEEHMMLEPKGIDAQMSWNCLHLLMASNDDWVVPAGMEERRFFVLDVKDTKIQNTKYFKAIVDEMNSGGKEAFLHVLKTKDISEYTHQDVPKTDALAEQVQISMKPEEAWWYNKLQSGEILTRSGGWTKRAPVHALHQDYVHFMQDIGAMRKSTPVVLGKHLARFNPPAFPKRRYEVCADETTGVDGRRPVYFFPSLDECRKYWDDKYFTGEWIIDEPEIVQKSPF